MNFLERRKAERFSGEIPIELQHGTGVTRDCSSDGVYFVTDQSFSVGEEIEFSMLLEHSGLEYPLRLRCLGEVLRAESFSMKTDVAVAFSMRAFEKGSGWEERSIQVDPMVDQWGRGGPMGTLLAN